MPKNKITYLILLVTACLLLVTNLFAQEEITITTYYPSPYGSYNELETRTLYFGETQDGLVSFKYPDTTYDRRLRITAGNADTANNDQGASIDLHGNDHANAGRLDLVAGRGNDITFWSSPAGTGALQRMTLDDNGNVGIGTTDPLELQGRLNVRASSSNGYAIGAFNAAGKTMLFLSDTTNGTTVARNITNNNGALKIGGPGADADLSPQMVISYAGNVGIGTAAPVSSLDVDGVVTFRDPPVGSAANQQADFRNGYTLWSDNLGAGTDNTRLWFDGPDGGEMVFGPRAGAPNLGNVRIRSNLISFERGGTSPRFVFNTTDDTATKQPAGGSWDSPSDIRLKKNISPISGALDKITQLRGVNFEWINPEEHTHGIRQGFIGQAIEKVFPNFITEVDASGKDKELVGKTKVKLLNLPFDFDAYLVEAIKELKAENDELKKRIEMLEAK